LQPTAAVTRISRHANFVTFSTHDFTASSRFNLATNAIPGPNKR